VSDTLLVCVPGLRYGFGKWESLLEFLKTKLGIEDADILKWDHHCSYLSTAYPEDLSRSLAAEIDAKWEAKKQTGAPYTKVILTGHSVGALFIREAFLIGLGGEVNKLPAQPWTTAVKRIVLFAGLNRGLFPRDNNELEKSPYRIQRWIGRQAIEFASALPFVHFLSEDLLSGSAFITNLRLWWMRKVPQLKRPPTVVQLMGAHDGIVRLSDSWDIENDPQGIQIVIPRADHASVIEIGDQSAPLVLRAIKDEIPPTPPPIAPSEQKSLVIFVLHGIRATNRTWARKATVELQALLPNAEIVPATYWYFSALDFLVPISRRNRLRWFRDTYAYYFSRNPQADFRFLGHSNGTYLLGQSLQQLSGMRFSKVVLAGSVLPRDFDWRPLKLTNQISDMWNHCSRFDIPVAILCNALRGLRMKDVGTGGYDGFSTMPNCNCQYHKGGHGAPLEDDYRPILVKQVAGIAVDQCTPKFQGENWFDHLSNMARILPFLIFMIIGVASVFWIGPHIAARFLISKTQAAIESALAILFVIAVFLKFY
jgi:hypothetical protein